jgi:hypothetical protein
LHAGDLGGASVECPKRMLADLGGQCDVQAISEVGHTLSIELQSHFQSTF